MDQESKFELLAECVQLDISASDWQDAIEKACQPLIRSGYVKDGYPADVIARESSGPPDSPQCRWG